MMWVAISNGRLLNCLASWNAILQLRSPNSFGGSEMLKSGTWHPIEDTASAITLRVSFTKRRNVIGLFLQLLALALACPPRLFCHFPHLHIRRLFSLPFLSVVVLYRVTQES